MKETKNFKLVVRNKILKYFQKAGYVQDNRSRWRPKEIQ